MANGNQDKKNSLEYQTQLYKSGRVALLILILLTLLNIVLLFTEAQYYLLFSASIPYYLVIFGQIMDLGFVETYTITALVIAGVILAVYFLCWLLSKKRMGWLVAALVLFSLDTLALLGFAFWMSDDAGSFLVDIGIHALVIWELAQGVLAGRRCQKLRESAPPAPVTPSGAVGSTPDLPE